MPRDTTGIYTLPEAPFVANTLAQSARVNSNNNDIGAGLTDSLSRSGKGTMQADLPMGNHKITGMADGTAAGDAMTFGQGGGAINNIGRNRIINGAFRINQRGQVSGVALSSGVYGHDRWRAGPSGCTYTFTSSGGITITAGSLQQIIDAGDVEGGSYTVSWAGTAQGRVGAAAFAASPFTVTGIAAGSQIFVEFNAGTLDRAQVEPGATKSAFEWLTRSQALEACKSFFQIVEVNWAGYAPSGSTCVMTAPLVPEMRANPALSVVSSGGMVATVVAVPNSTRSVRLSGSYAATGFNSFSAVINASCEL